MQKKPKNILLYPRPHPDSTFTKLNKFFVSKAGRTFSSYLIAGAAAGIIAVKFGAQTFFISYYKDFLQCYEFGIPKQVPERIENLVAEAAEKIRLIDYKREFIRSFIVSGFDLKTIGSMSSNYFGWVGVPSNYLYETPDDIDKENIRIGQNVVKWNSEDGALLEQAIILTNEEQLFAFCNAVYELNSNKLYYDNLTPSAILLALYAGGVLTNQKQNLYIRPAWIRYTTYSLFGFFGYSVYCFIKDFSQNTREKSIDSKLAALGPDTIKAGISYYDKLLKKNIALNKMLDKQFYTNEGNEKFLFRQRSIPLTERKRFFEKALVQWEKEQEQKETKQEQDDGTDDKNEKKK